MCDLFAPLQKTISTFLKKGREASGRSLQKLLRFSGKSLRRLSGSSARRSCFACPVVPNIGRLGLADRQNKIGSGTGDCHLDFVSSTPYNFLTSRLANEEGFYDAVQGAENAPHLEQVADLCPSSKNFCKFFGEGKGRRRQSLWSLFCSQAAQVFPGPS